MLLLQEAIPRGYSCKSKFPPWIYYNLRYYLVKKNYFHHRFKKKLSDYFYNRFASYRKLVKNTVKSDGLGRLMYIDNKLSYSPSISGNMYLISENTDLVPFR
jgi:hypothetical protein